MKHLAVIGSTGSIGLNTLNVIDSVKTNYRVTALAVGRNIEVLSKQIKKYRPKFVCVWDEKQAELLKKKRFQHRFKILSGEEGLTEIVCHPEIHTVVFGLSGSKSLKPLLESLKTGKRIAVANKEPLVLAGSLIQKLCRKYHSEIIPIDSEHSAIFQCLLGNDSKDVEKILLTSSGGPFFRLPKKDFKNVTVSSALKHPKWKMGRKISIDSATMMNKALELIEAKTLFDVKPRDIEIVIHPEAIIHSMVQYRDGSVMAQMGEADMRLPIQFALTFPKRSENRFNRVDFFKIGKFEFFPADLKKFPSIRLAYWAAEEDGTLPTVLNAADEVCVEAFLKEKISFNKIVRNVEKVMLKHKNNKRVSYTSIMEADRWAREEAEALC